MRLLNQMFSKDFRMCLDMMLAKREQTFSESLMSSMQRTLGMMNDENPPSPQYNYRNYKIFLGTLYSENDWKPSIVDRKDWSKFNANLQKNGVGPTVNGLDLTKSSGLENLIASCVQNSDMIYEDRASPMSLYVSARLGPSIPLAVDLGIYFRYGDQRRGVVVNSLVNNVDGDKRSVDLWIDSVNPSFGYKVPYTDMNGTSYRGLDELRMASHISKNLNKRVYKESKSIDAPAGI